MSRGKSLLKNTIILGFGTLLPKFAQFITLPIYTAMLTKAEYGTYDLVLILTSLLVPILTLQIERAAFRFLIEENDDNQQGVIISNVYFFVIPIAVIASTVIFIMLMISGPTSLISILISFYVFIDIVVIATRQISRGLGRNKPYSASSIINSILNVVLAIFLLSILNKGLAGLLISLNVALLFSLVYLIRNINIFRKIKFNSINKGYMKLMLKFSIPMVPNSLSLWVVQVSDRLIVTGILGIEANAVYAVANKIPSMFALAYNTFNMAWQESASAAYDDKDSDKYYSDIFDNLFNFLVGVMAILIGFTPIIFNILIKGPYDEAYYQMPILFLGIFFSSLSAYYGGIYIALKKTKKIGISSLLGAMVNIIINLSLIKHIGLYAASISTLISYFILVIYRLNDTKKMRNINYRWKKIIFSLAILGIMSVISYQRDFYLNTINLLIGIVIGILINKELLYKMFQRVQSKIKKR